MPTDVEKAQAELRAQRLTQDTRVIVSFGAREGGFELTLQLRLDIMDRYGRRRMLRDPAGKFMGFAISDEAFCYLDAVTLAEDPMTRHPQVELNYGSEAAPNWRKVDIYKMQNPFWDVFYPKAAKNATVMVFQVTKWWMGSEYCLQELGWFLVESIQAATRGEPTPCILMVFEESKVEFAELLTQLRSGLETGNPGQKLVDAKYTRMLQALQPLLDDWAQTKAQRQVALTQVQLPRVFDYLKSRCVTVPAYQGFGFTDLYDAQQQRIAQDPRQTAQPAHDYKYDFAFNYGFDEAFRQRFFELLDADLRKKGIAPVPGA
jgi:hypothetical protein